MLFFVSEESVLILGMQPCFEGQPRTFHGFVSRQDDSDCTSENCSEDFVSYKHVRNFLECIWTYRKAASITWGAPACPHPFPLIHTLHCYPFYAFVNQHPYDTLN